MRVVSGIFKGRKLFAPEDNSVRPTTDRIKETLFNILSSKDCVGEISVLDLFGGSGALGIEALSRGAKKVVFIDKSVESIRLIKQNLSHVKADEKTYETFCVDYEFALKKLKDKEFDLIFADPPYSAGLENSIIKKVADYGVLSKNGVLVIERSVKTKMKCAPFVEDARVCGNTVLSFLSYEKEIVNNE